MATITLQLHIFRMYPSFSVIYKKSGRELCQNFLHLRNQLDDFKRNVGHLTEWIIVGFLYLSMTVVNERPAVVFEVKWRSGKKTQTRKKLFSMFKIATWLGRNICRTWQVLNNPEDIGWFQKKRRSSNRMNNCRLSVLKHDSGQWKTSSCIWS